MQQRIAELERAEESRKNTSPDSRDTPVNPTAPTLSNGCTSGNQTFSELNQNMHQTADTASQPLDSRPFGGLSYGNAMSRPVGPVRFATDSDQILSLAQNPRLVTSAQNTTAISHSSSTDGPEDTALKHAETLPPNDEIGVVAPRFGYYGDSSALTFMSQVRSVLDHAESGAGNLESEPSSPAAAPVAPTSTNTRPNRNLAGFQRAADLQLYALPSREHADALLEGYWAWVHNLHPYLDRTHFSERYESIWGASRAANSGRGPEHHSSTSQAARDADRMTKDERGDKKTFYCTLNIVFALSCQFDPTLDPAGSGMSDIFWQRAKTLIEQDFNIFNKGSIPLIQALLLFSAYMQSTELSGGCWLTCSAAISVAQINGLHEVHSGVPPGFKSQKELDLRRRVWGGCIMLDRSLSMIYGRPSIMTSRTWVGHHNRLHNHGLSPNHSPIKTRSPDDSFEYPEFFHHNVQLHNILGAILAEFYERPPDEEEDQPPPLRNATGSKRDAFHATVMIRRINDGDFQSLLQFDTALLQWKSQLPAQLRFPFDSEIGDPQSNNVVDTEVAHRQAAVMHARFWHIRILLFRPLLLRTLADFRRQARQSETNDEQKSTLHEGLLVQSSVLCISAAQELSRLITENLEKETDLLPEWWHDIFLTNAASVPIPTANYNAASSLNVVGQTDASDLENLDYHGMPHASLPPDGQNMWAFDDFHDVPAHSVDAYFTNWSPNSTNMAFLTAIPFESGQLPQ
ncbi:uncharacterized protein AB675_7396 [Cyphellophora attinorum]|uniref:Xylanolytic transcriptional activator regulatory domain-containing protein n=1 Tax=Cyphellophora attinorum TaxID=1664694 RepID=A0A0N1HK74_9EURO|nr:uncharacterized protein AB675_7396 [Phialophora attinorum]KPI34545.1 hypothetical protein AB675_7396 [Phialophora attinorum]